MSRPLLFPVDRSPGSALAQEHAFELARRYDAPLLALYVVDTNTTRWSFAAEPFVRSGEQVLARVHRQAAEAGLSVETELRRGTPHEEILAFREERDARTVVMGTHGRTGVDRLRLGSVTERVVRLSAVPVLAVGGADDASPRTDYGSILLPTDGSDAAASALGPAVDLARAYDASLHVVHAVDADIFDRDGTGDLDTERHHDAGREAVDDLESRARDAGVDDVTTAVREGAPADVILTYCEENDVDCIAMSTHGRSGLPRYLLGSTTERVLRHTSRPVLCVPLEESVAGTSG